jgi:hypothetical protein
MTFTGAPVGFGGAVFVALLLAAAGDDEAAAAVLLAALLTGDRVTVFVGPGCSVPELQAETASAPATMTAVRVSSGRIRRGERKADTC